MLRVPNYNQVSEDQVKIQASFVGISIWTVRVTSDPVKFSNPAGKISRSDLS